MGSIRLFDGSEGTYSFTISPTGRFLVSSKFSENSLSVWDISKGQLVSTVAVERAGILSVGLSADDSTVAVPPSRGEGAPTLFELRTGTKIRTLEGSDITSSVFAFSKDGHFLASSWPVPQIWDTATGNRLVSHFELPGGSWITITPEGFFEASPNGASDLNVVRGLDVYSIDQVKQELYRPDLVRAKLASDPEGAVAAAAAKLDLTKVIGTGQAPKVSITAPVDGATVGDDGQVTVEADFADQGGGIGRVEWRVNGVTIGIEARGFDRLAALGSTNGAAEPTPAVGALSLKRVLTLEPGDNKIELVAFNARNLIASEPAAVTVHRAKPMQASLVKPKLHVLAVGVNAYWDSRLTLAYAAPDATAIAGAFRKASGGLFSAVDVTIVLDADVTASHLDQVFAGLGKTTGSEDVFVFFMAGHGKTIDGRYYFLPQDFHYRDEHSVEKDGIGQDRLQQWFAEIPARKSILLYDTCDSGSLTGAHQASRGLGELEALQRLIWATGRTTLTASTDDAPALEGYRGHGVFTYALLDGFGAADENKDGVIDVTELAGYIDRQVPLISQDAFQMRQVPQMSIVGSSFALADTTVVLTNKESAGGAGTSGASSTIPVTPTHVVVASADVFAGAGTGAALVRLTPGTQVRLIETKDGWSLIAKGGKKLGYVQERTLASLQ